MICVLLAVGFFTMGNTAPQACVTVAAPPVVGDPGAGGGGGGVEPPDEPKPQYVGLARRYSLKCSSRPSGIWSNGFGHLNGSCYACPREYPVRTMAKISGPKACGNSILKGRASAKYYGPKKSCPSGDITMNGSCWYCPSGSRYAGAGRCVKLG